MAILVRTILVGLPGDITDAAGTWRSGFRKQPVRGPVRLRRDNLDGDGQDDRTVHGGPEKALLGYAADHYDRWRAELARGDLADGAFGENLALTGIDEETVAIGDRFRLGTAEIEVAQPRQPCWKLARRCGLPDMPAKAIANGRLGWYFRVLVEGECAAGQPLEPLGRSSPEWTIARINRLLFGPAAKAAPLFDEVLHLPALSAEFAPVCRRRFPSLAG